MKKIFVDTSGWDAIEDASDANHEAAMSFKGDIAGKSHLVTTSYILDETYTLLLLDIGYTRTVNFKRNIDVMAESGVLEIVQISEDIEKQAWEAFERFNIDKEWSYTDCTSKVVMERRNINEVFAFDHHFEQMGFVRKP